MKKDTAENLLALVKNNYRQIATDFDVTRQKEIWPEVRNLAMAIKDGDKILDVGCGNGRLLETITDRKIEYLGIDNSEELIQLAKQHYSKNKFLVADILNLQNISDIPSGVFNYIFCLAVLQHIPSKELRIKALREMKDKLAVNGEIIISVWNLWSPAWKQKKYRQLVFKNWFLKIIGKNDFDFGDLIFPWKNSRGEVISERYYHAFKGNELRKLTRRAGLKVRNITKDRYNYWLILSN
jgi:2-polyprenyl-3-methyl-5-hydroxy-6-metoxy-1,4-benzoquinol methylase